MLDLLAFADPVSIQAGIKGILDNFRGGWIEPAFIFLIVAVGVTLGVKRQWIGLIVFILFAAILSVVIFFPELLFGGSGTLTDVGKGVGEGIQY